MNEIETTEDTNNVTEVAKNVALEVGKELAVTAAGCVVALALTSGVNVLANKVRAHRAAKKSETVTVATAI
jgi:hypothetical protein